MTIKEAEQGSQRKREEEGGTGEAGRGRRRSGEDREKEGPSHVWDLT